MLSSKNVDWMFQHRKSRFYKFGSPSLGARLFPHGANCEYNQADDINDLPNW